MSNYGSNQVSPILVDGYDVSPGPMTDVSLDVQALTELNHGLGDNWQKSAWTNLRKFVLSMKGFYEDTANSVRDAFNDAKNGLTRIICYSVEGNTIGKHFVGLAAAGENSFKRLPSLGVLIKAEIGFAAGGANCDPGQIVHNYVAESSATGDTTASSVDNNNDPQHVNIVITGTTKANPCVITTSQPHGLVSGDVIFISGDSLAGPAINGQQTVTFISATTFSVPVNTTASTGAGNDGTLIQVDSDNGGYGYLQQGALTLGGFTNFAPLIKHSTDNASWGTIVTFAVVTTAPSAQRIVVAAGTKINRYLAAFWSYGGAGAGQSAKFFIGFSRNVR